ncbi:Membrane-associated phospholipid phosphatase [Candidatus Thermokryptus mobilis]|uniref:Membrane-associated phospholipid phosphatase n=1 Tax=Candidatus Thermokryptus mobilis TaxID=1643428 RepID=A0A0S4MSU3_9BACT|nr:phosphatase PAP2 family protein [Candidatus Thermokryptus mobilis]CUU01785.1 Membrane-associated phospholipid phosphatase [Candidatus Thermokryptus mobilis]
MRNLLLLFIFSFQVSFAQGLYDRVSADIKLFSKNAKNYFTAPLNFNARDRVNLAFVGFGTIALFGFDHLNKDIQKIDNDFFTTLMKIDSYYGTVWVFGVISGSLYLSGLLLNEGELRETGLMVFESGVFAGTVTTVLKVAFGRERPFVSGDKFKFRPFSFKGNPYYSLPSGHATLSFAISSVLASRFENKIVKAIIYTPAVLTALARVYNNQHWFSDVFLGSAIGYFTGVYIVKLNSER